MNNQEVYDYFVETYGLERFCSMFKENESNFIKAGKGMGRTIKPVYRVLMEREKRLNHVEELLNEKYPSIKTDEVIQWLDEKIKRQLKLENDDLKKRLKRYESAFQMMGEVQYKLNAIEEFISK